MHAATLSHHFSLFGVQGKLSPTSCILFVLDILPCASQIPSLPFHSSVPLPKQLHGCVNKLSCLCLLSCVIFHERHCKRWERRVNLSCLSFFLLAMSPCTGSIISSLLLYRTFSPCSNTRFLPLPFNPKDGQPGRFSSPREPHLPNSANSVYTSTCPALIYPVHPGRSRTNPEISMRSGLKIGLCVWVIYTF